MKLMHIADLHLDRAFEGLKNIPESFGAQLKQINQHVFTKIVDKAIEYQVDALIIAGDTFHQPKVSIQTQAFLIRELERLNLENIPVILTFGNHDYYAEERYWFRFPKNVRLFTDEKVTTIQLTTKANERVAISSFSYTQPWIEENKLKEFPEKKTDCDIHIGIYHGEMNRSESHNYAPFSLQEMKQKNYDYWALGHIHQTQVLSAQPLMVYSGTPQGHTKKETKGQGVAITTVTKGEGTVRFEPVEDLLWKQESYSLKDCKSLQDTLQYLTAACVKNNQSKLILMELLLSDTTHLGETFKLSYENGELLQFLQQKVLKETKNQLLITGIKIVVNREAERMLIPASSNLLMDLRQTYDDDLVFNQTLQELLQNPLITEVIEVNSQWREKSLENAIKRIQADFTFREGGE